MIETTKGRYERPFIVETNGRFSALKLSVRMFAVGRNRPV
jgi:hypothetical protein